MNSILVTGGTGSFGQAFVRFMLQTGIQRICIYSRGEHQQAAMRAALGDDPRCRWMIGDVRDAARLERAMQGVDIVIHAAALKRIETGFYNPDEMVKTNVLGTLNVVEAARRASVSVVVGLSSDKAYQPVSPYGQSKALAESILLAGNDMFGGRPKFAATRYGNVWNAQGSVVPAWRAAVEAGQPIRVTDHDCTRFFMTIDEAVKMVVDLMTAMWLCKPYEPLTIPDWLPAYRLGDLLEAFGMPYAVATGLPQWEKLHESMRDGLCSADARRMTVDELRKALTDAR